MFNYYQFRRLATDFKISFLSVDRKNDDIKKHMYFHHIQVVKTFVPLKLTTLLNAIV